MRSSVRAMASSSSRPVRSTPAPRRVTDTMRVRVEPSSSTTNKFVEFVPISIAATGISVLLESCRDPSPDGVVATRQVPCEVSVEAFHADSSAGNTT